jgi:hypothetical protein
VVVAVTVTANVLFTDLVASTAVLARHGEEAAEEIRRRHDELVANVIAVFGGEVLKSTGDGALALLPSADLLVRAGSAIVAAGRAQRIALRVGAASGDVVREGADCFGEAAVVASRLCDAAASGEMLVAPTTASIRGRRIDPPLRQGGPRRLKGFDEPVAAFALEEVVADVSDDLPDMGPARRALGRDDTLDVIRAGWRDAPGRLEIVCGEPGIGKTHVVRAAVAELDAAVVWVSFESGAADGFERLRAAIDGAVKRRDVGPVAALGPDTVARAASLLPTLAARLPLASLGPTTDDRTAAFDALLAVIRTLARQVVIVLDDVQWAGGTTLALLAGRPCDDAVQIIATSRLPLPPDVAALDATIVPLSPLPEHELVSLLRDRGYDDEVATDAAQQAGGNPFLALVAAGGGGVGDGSNAVAGRFLGLPPEVTDVLGVAALMGRRVDLPVVEHVHPGGRDVVRHAVDVALHAGLLRETTRGTLFAHDLVRDAALRQVPLHTRVRYHAQIATLLEARGDVSAAASHVLDGFADLDPLDAARRIDVACDRLRDVGAYEEALALTRRLVDELDADPRATPGAFAVARLAFGDAHFRLGEIAEHKRQAALAGWAALAADDVTSLARAALQRAAYGVAGIADPETLELLDTALGRVPDDDLALTSQLLAMRAFYLYNYEGRGADARTDAAKALDMARHAGDELAYAEVLQNCSFVLLAQHEVHEQQVVVDELLRLAPRLPYPQTFGARSAAHRQGAVLRLQFGDRVGFDHHRAQIDALAARTSSWLLTRLATMWNGLACLLDGDPAGAGRHAALLMSSPEHEHNIIASGAGQLVAATRWHGTLASVAPMIVEFALATPGLPLARSLAAIATVIGGDIAGGAELLAPVVGGDSPLVDDSTLSAQCATLVEACTLTGLPLPPGIEPELQSFGRQLLVMSWGVDAPGAADRFLGILAARRGERAAATDLFVAAEALERRVSPPLALRTQGWRHVLLGDVPAPAVPPELDGLALEMAALTVATGP